MLPKYRESVSGRVIPKRIYKGDGVPSRIGLYGRFGLVFLECRPRCQDRCPKLISV